MREIAVISGEEATKLKDGENDLCISLQDREGHKVAVVYYLGEAPQTS